MKSSCSVCWNWFLQLHHSLHKTVISVEYDKVTSHANHKDPKNIYFKLHFILTQAIFLTYVKISTHSNFTEPRKACHFLTHAKIWWTHATHAKILQTHATHAPTLPTLFSRLIFKTSLFSTSNLILSNFQCKSWSFTF